MFDTCLSDLSAQLNGLLPTCPTGQTCAEPHQVHPADPCIQLKHMPLIGSVTITDSCGATVDPKTYVIDYTTGAILAPCTQAHTLFVAYSYNLADTYIRQAVNDLGFRLRQRNTMQIPSVACCGVAPLPCSIHRIFSISEVDCCADPCQHCGGGGCHQCNHTCQPRKCQCHSGHYHGSKCSMYIRGNELVFNPPPAEDAMLEICYEGGYPLDKDGCFVGLTPELADLVLLKAQALAYRSPALLMAIANLSINRSSGSDSSASGGGTSSNTETTTTVKTKDNCGKEEKTVTTKVGASNSNKSSSSTASALSSLFSSGASKGLADQFETLYEAAIRRRSGMATLHISQPRTGYRARIAAYC